MNDNFSKTMFGQKRKRQFVTALLNFRGAGARVVKILTTSRAIPAAPTRFGINHSNGFFPKNKTFPQGSPVDCRSFKMNIYLS